MLRNDVCMLKSRI